MRGLREGLGADDAEMMRNKAGNLKQVKKKLKSWLEIVSEKHIFNPAIARSEQTS